MPTTIYLKQWARQHGIAPTTAYRWFQQDKLPEGVHARRLPSGSIVVDVAEPDPLDHLDPHALVALLRNAGYVILTRDQAHRLGIPPEDP
ncbi:hypothetical protein [Amycolatopsis thermophila]|uniref:Uncharacterized protein n=1 Tax=Amycolatopsis thermophila TaxID=206084 RepID=A0ABU0EMN1_9PSEU|nr:hypothetical protein [Amycolatopsis thermophila]MDQ0376527.1 hypothetical protein [Amycolatopsis thermophila]